MVLPPLVIQILTVLGPLVLGWLLRHWGIQLPGLPAVPANPVAAAVTSLTATQGGTPSLLSQLVGKGEGDAAKLLDSAIKDALAKGLAELKAKA